MKLIRRWIARLLGLFRSERLDQDFADELDAHLQMHIDDNIRLGMTPDAARRKAIMKLGGIESTKQAYRERRTAPLIENVIQDCKFAVRQLRKNPGFTITAILMLMLGTSASIAIFAFVDAALIKPLPYKDPTRLVGVFEQVNLFPQSNLSYPDFVDWKRLNTVFASMDAYNRNGSILATPDGAETVGSAVVTAGFFRTLGITPVLGRDFHDGEDQQGTPQVVMLSFSTWQMRYGGATDAVGKVITVDGQPSTIIGVLPQDFHFAPVASPELWATERDGGSCEKRRSCHNLYGVARLKDGVTPQAALAEMTSIAKQLEIQYPDSNRGQGASIVPLSDVIVGRIRPTLLALLGGAAMLLLIATVNVSSLLLVRSESRKREIAVRIALGATPSRLIRLFVTEGALLSCAGAGLGLAAAYWLMQLLIKLIPENLIGSLPYLLGLHLNSKVLGFAGIVAVISAALFSFTPALHLSLSELRAGLAEGSRGSAGTGWRRLGSKLVVLELAIAMILLVGAGLLGKSMYRLLNVPLNITIDHVATLQVIKPQAQIGKNNELTMLGREVVRRVGALPGVKSVGLSTRLPITGNGNTTWFRIPGRPYNGEHNEANERQVNPGYFATLEAKMIRGRSLSDDDDSSHSNVAIINQALAKKYFSGEDPVGQQLGDNVLSANSMRQIVGVVDDIKEGSLDSEIWPAVYVPFDQQPQNYFIVVARTEQAEESIIPTLSNTMHDIDHDIITFGGTTMKSFISNSPSAYLHRSSAWLVGGFAGMALLLSVVGLYGVIAYSVTQRTREIGVRVALGAGRGAVYQLILREAGWLIGLGLSIGLICSVAVAVTIKGLLFGVSSWDAQTLIGVAVVLGGAGLLASFIPARRAASVNPVEALRAE